MKLHKSMTDRVLFGVCGGIGESLGINSYIIRAAFVILALLSRSLFVFLYFILAQVLPYGRSDGGGSRGGYYGSGHNKTYKPEPPPFDISDAQDVEIDEE